jgi:hypothetical protein
MPNPSSYADLVRDWELLLTAAQDNAAELAEAEPQRAALAQHLEATRAVKARQDSAGAIKQQITQELNKMLVDGRELAIRLRNAVRSFMGHRNERLVQFGVAPLRKRQRRPKKPTEGEDPGETSPVPAPKAGEKNKMNIE